MLVVFGVLIGNTYIYGSRIWGCALWKPRIPQGTYSTDFDCKAVDSALVAVILEGRYEFPDRYILGNIGGY